MIGLTASFLSLVTQNERTLRGSMQVQVHSWTSTSLSISLIIAPAAVCRNCFCMPGFIVSQFEAEKTKPSICKRFCVKMQTILFVPLGIKTLSLLYCEQIIIIQLPKMSRPYRFNEVDAFIVVGCYCCTESFRVLLFLITAHEHGVLCVSYADQRFK